METKIKRLEQRMEKFANYLKQTGFVSETCSNMIIELNQSVKALRVEKIKLKQNFEYNPEAKILSQHGVVVSFTKTELKLFDYLISQDGVVGFDPIHAKVWEEKSMSMFTLRNMIKNIRTKTYDSIIINHSNIGYEFNKDGK